MEVLLDTNSAIKSLYRFLRLSVDIPMSSESLGDPVDRDDPLHILNVSKLDESLLRVE